MITPTRPSPGRKGPPSSTRKSYKIGFKIKVAQFALAKRQEFADWENGNKESARPRKYSNTDVAHHFGIFGKYAEKNVRTWIKEYQSNKLQTQLVKGLRGNVRTGKIQHITQNWKSNSMLMWMGRLLASLGCPIGCLSTNVLS